MAKDKQHLILALTPSGTEEEKSYKSLSSTPCGSLHSVRSRSQANLAAGGSIGAEGGGGGGRTRSAKQSPSLSPRHRKKATSTERVVPISANHNEFLTEVVTLGPNNDGRLYLTNAGGGFASQIDASSRSPQKVSPRHLAPRDLSRDSPTPNGVPHGSFAPGMMFHKYHKPPRPPRFKSETRSPQTSSKLTTADVASSNLTYQSFASHPNYGSALTPSSYNSSYHSTSNSWNHSEEDDDEEEDVPDAFADHHQHPYRTRIDPTTTSMTNGHHSHNNWPNKPAMYPQNQPNLPTSEHLILSTSEITTESGQQIFAPYQILSSNPLPANNSSSSNVNRPVPNHPSSSMHPAAPGNGLDPLSGNLETSKQDLNQRISLLFGKIGSSAFELLDEHKESLGDCVNNEYTLASLFEHKTGSLFFYGMVDTIFWNSSTKTMSLVEFQTTVKATPSPYHLLQLYCFKEIADKKKICKRIKLYVLGLHLESDGPRLKLWRYKATGAMPSLKALLFDSKVHTQERLYSCPEFNFMGRLMGKQGKEVVYEMV